MNIKRLPYNVEDVLDNIYNYVSIIDGNGVILFVNNAIKRYGKTKNDIIGKNIEQLLDEGYMQQSIVKKFIENGKPIGMVQHDSDGTFLDWASGHYDADNNLEYVVCTEWDLHHLNDLQDLLIYQNTLTVDENQELDYYRDKNLKIEKIISNSSAMQEAFNTADLLAKTDIPVLLLGESGTGKEVMMKYIHYKSNESKGPLIEVNCSAIPEQLMESELFGYEKGAFTGADPKGKRGYFELANNGTLFLDEIGELPLKMQGKLLRVLQEKKIMKVGGSSYIPVNPRIIAATNIDLEEAVENQRFRLDLYYRLNVMQIILPPLRERKEDIAAFTEYFVQQNTKKYKKNISITASAITLMEQYEWPGNVRELKNMIERIFIMFHDGIINEQTIIKFLPGVKQNLSEKKEGSKIDLKKLIEEFEKDVITSRIGEYKNLRQFSQLFGIEKTTMHRKLKKYKITTKNI